MHSECPRQGYSFLKHGILYTELLEGSVPTKPTLGKPIPWVRDTHSTMLGGLGVLTCAKSLASWKSVSVVPSLHQEMKAGKSFLKIGAKMGKGNYRGSLGHYIL